MGSWPFGALTEELWGWGEGLMLALQAARSGSPLEEGCSQCFLFLLPRVQGSGREAGCPVCVITGPTRLSVLPNLG